MNVAAIAHRAVARAVKKGDMPAAKFMRCVDCGRGAQHYDHRDYLAPLEVQPVCRSCNSKRGPAKNAPLVGKDRTSLGRFLALAPRGEAARMAEALCVQYALVAQWASGVRQVPAEHCPAVERATAGAVTCEEMRPDVRWHRVRDRKWPNPAGRPLIDVSAAAPTAQPTEAAQ